MASTIGTTLGERGHVKGSSYNRVVLLTGEVPTEADRSAVEVLGEVDAMKFRSCVTLFAEVWPGERCFADALRVFYDGTPDPETLRLLAASRTDD